ncbi:MAG: autotransporter-associated beta strand repeat-containing protein [Chthoniobacteraceae bacterium]
MSNIRQTISNIRLTIVSVLTLLFAGTIQAQTTWTDADTSGSYADPLNWSPNGVPDASTNVLFNTGASVTLTGTTNAAGTITVNNGADAVMNLGPSDVLTISGASFAQALFVEGGGTFGLSGGTLNVALGQIFVGDLNGNGTLNIAGNLNFDVNDSGSNYAYMVVGRNSNPAGDIVNSGSTTGQGIVNQTSGVVTSGGNFDIGLDNGNGTYNLSGGQLVTGSNSTLFPIYIGFNQDAGDTAGTTQGLLNITGSGTFTLGAGGQLRVGSGNNLAGDGDSATVGANGKIIQNGAGTVVTFNGGNNGGVWFGSLASAAPGTTITGGSGVYELDAGTLNIDSGIVSFGDSVSTSGTLNQNGGLLDASQAGTSTATIYIGNSGTGVYNLTSGTAIFGNGLTLGNNAGSSGTVNQSGGLLTISGGQLDLAQANSTYNISSGTLQVGGANGITGAGVLSGSGGMIQVIGSDLTTGITITLADNTRLYLDTNSFDATLNGTVSGTDGGLTKVGAGDLTLTAANNNIASFYIEQGNVNQGAGSSLTTYELSVGYLTGNTGNYTMSGGSIFLPGDQAPSLVGSAGDIGSLRIGDFGGSGTFTQTGGIVTDDAALSIGNRGGTGTYDISGSGELIMGTALYVLGRNQATGDTVSSQGTLNIGSGAFVSLAAGGEFILSSNSITTDSLAVGQGSSGTVVQTGGTFQDNGTIYLSGAGTGEYDLDGGVLQVGGNGLRESYNGLGGSYRFNLGGGTIQVTGSDLTTSVDMSLTAATTSTIDTNGLNATFSGNITGTAGGLVKTGAGKFTFSGSNNVGGIAIQGGTATNGTGTTNTVELTVGYNQPGSDGFLSVTSGVINVAGSDTNDGFTVGSGTGSVGDAAISGGVINVGNASVYSHFFVGTFGGVGTVEQSGGTVNVTGPMQIANRGGNGTYTLSSGTLNIGVFAASGDSDALIIGRTRAGDAATSGTLNITGGTLVLSDNTPLLIGGDGSLSTLGSGVVNQSGSSLVTANLFIELGGDGTGTYNLDGGTLQVGGVNGIRQGGGTANFNLGGGTLQVIGSDFTTSVNASLTAATTSTVDTNYFNATFSGILSGSGALTKVGSGTLTLSATSSYSGATTVNGGALYVNGAIDNSNVTVNSGATLGGNGSTGGITVAAGGTFSPGNSPASFSATSLAVNAGGVYKVDIVGGGAPVGGASYTQTTLSGSGAVLSLNGTPSTGSVLQLSISGALRPGGIGSDANPYVAGGSNTSLDNYFILVLGTGTRASAGDQFSTVTDGTNTVSIDYSSLNQFNGEDGLGTFMLDGQEWVISYTGDAADGGTIGGNDVVLTAIPEPGAWAMLAGGFGMLLCWRRLPRWREKLVSS